MSVPRSRFTKITLALVAGLTLTAPVLAQNAQTYVANGRYARLFRLQAKGYE